MDVINSLLLVVLGWLLGLVGPAIQERIRRRYQSGRIRSAIISELTQLREQCASTTVTIETKAGRLSKDLLTWHRSVHGDHPLPPPLDQLTQITERLECVDDAVFAELALRLKSPPGAGINLKELDLPYTKVKVTDLELFSESGRRRILEILSRIRIFNQIVDESRFFFKLTFDGGISQENHASAQAQVQSSCDSGSQQSRLISDLVGLALKELQRDK
jgi:hypothetical protein